MTRIWNKWRRALFDAIHGAREWDSEPLGPLFLERFARKFIHFEGQHPRNARRRETRH